MDTKEKQMYRNFDEGTEFLSAEERGTYLRTMRHIADTAINAGCRQLLPHLRHSYK